MDRKEAIDRLENLDVPVERLEDGVLVEIFVHDALLVDLVKLLEVNERIAQT